MPMPKGLTERAKLRWISEQLDTLLTGQGELKSQFTSFQETVLTMLNKNEQAIVDAFNASTTKVGASVAGIGTAIDTATKAITDLFNNQSTITLADVQPHLTALDTASASLDSAASALTSLATTDDPALGATTTPIVVTNPDGTTTPVSETPIVP